MKVILAIYNFIVGDMIILIGILITVAIIAVISLVPALAPLRTIGSGILLIVAVLTVLSTTLAREATSKER